MTPDDLPAGGYLADFLGFWAVWIVLAAAAFVLVRRWRNRGGWLRVVAGNLLLLLALLWTAVVAGETYLRYVYDETDSMGFMLTTNGWLKRHMHRNADGFRDREWSPAKAPGVVRVACFGDSFTVGWGVKDPADCFPQRVAAALEARSPGRFDVRNYGVGGLTTREEIDLIARRLTADRIDRIVLGYCMNDASDLLPPSEQWYGNTVRRIPWIRPTLSFVADFVWYRFWQRRNVRVTDFAANQKIAYDRAEIWAAQEAQFAELAELCRRASVRLDVVVFPFYSDWGPAYRFDSCHEQIAAAWAKLGVEVIDLRERCRGRTSEELVVNRFDGHPSVLAHEIAAQAVLERMFGAK